MKSDFAMFVSGTATIKMEGLVRFVDEAGEVVTELDLSKQGEQKLKLKARERSGYDEYFLIFESQVWPPS